MTDGRFMAELERNHCATCEHCGRMARINKMRVHSTLALMLARLYYQSRHQHGHPTGWVHIEQFKPKSRTGNDFSIVKHWDLAIPKSPALDEDKKSSGMWQLTAKGVAFVENRLSIPKYAFVLDDEVRFFSPDEHNMEEAVKRKFSYNELFDRMTA